MGSLVVLFILDKPHISWARGEENIEGEGGFSYEDTVLTLNARERFHYIPYMVADKRKGMTLCLLL